MTAPQLTVQEVDVSDHAVVRWLERVCGADIARIRAEIRTALVAGGFTELHAAGSVGVYVDVPQHNVHLIVRDGAVTTCFPSGEEPD